MNSVYETIRYYMQSASGKYTVSLRTLRDKLPSLSQYQLLDHLKQMNCEISRQSVVNPHYYPRSNPKHSSKNKAQVLQQSVPVMSYQEMSNSENAAAQIITQISQVVSYESHPEREEGSPEPLPRQTVSLVSESAVKVMNESYMLTYGEQAEEFLTKDTELIQTAIGKNPRVHRIRILISDPELISHELKNNVVYYILYSSLQMVKLFQTPQDKVRNVQEMWLAKLIKFVNPHSDPAVQGVLDMIRSL